jgi:type II secretory pathway pseudopilin PulG
MNRTALRCEHGYALVTTIVLMSIMLSLGLAIVAYSDGQTTQTRTERVRESSFNLAERALEQQTFKLSRAWAGSASTAYPASCTPATPLSLCPSNTELISAGDSPDANAETTWTTVVRDNGDLDPATDNTGEDFYSSALIDARPSWDANKDGALWVRATATVRGKTRTLVAKVRVESLTLPFPKTSIIANTLVLSNNGNKTIVDTNGPNDGDVGPVLLRCAMPNPTDCVISNGGGAYDQTTDPRISPPSFGRPEAGTIVGPETITQLKDTAQANGTIYSTCPTDTQLTGAVVYIQTVPLDGCHYQINGSINSLDSPGIIVVEQSLGRFELRGNLNFYGLMYFLDSGGAPAADKIVLDMDGTIVIHGSVAVEGDGAIRAGSSGDSGQGDANLSFDQSLFGSLKTYGTAGILQNSWREIR